MKTDDELKDIARRMIRREILVLADVEEIKIAFMILLAAGARVPDDTVAVWGDMKDVVPGRSVNGYPLFTAMGTISDQEFPIFLDHLKRMEEALK